ncbi:hypothetical protein HK096_006261, partial [Nowakowskiella sp. JEL0078]
MERLFSWKTTRVKSKGVMNKGKVVSNSASILENASKNSFQFLKHPEISSPDDVKKAITELTKPLKGIGPATASAILASYSPTIPFMSDEAVLSLITKKGSTLHTLNNYLEYYSEVCHQVKKLNELDDEHNWCARDIEMALWTAMIDENLKLGFEAKFTAETSKNEIFVEENVDNSLQEQVTDNDQTVTKTNIARRKRNAEAAEL